MLRCNSKNSFRRLVVVEGEQLVGLHSSFFAYSFLLILSVLCPAKDKAWLELPGYTLVEDFMVSVARRNTGNGFLKSVSWVLNFYSVQFSSVVQSCPTLCDPMSVATRPPCPSSTPWVHPSPCPLSRWCHPTISFSVAPFSSKIHKELKLLNSKKTNNLIWKINKEPKQTFLKRRHANGQQI